MSRFELATIILFALPPALLFGGTWWWALAGMSHEIAQALTVTGCVAFYAGIGMLVVDVFRDH